MIFFRRELARRSAIGCGDPKLRDLIAVRCSIYNVVIAGPGQAKLDRPGGL